MGNVIDNPNSQHAREVVPIPIMVDDNIRLKRYEKALHIISNKLGMGSSLLWVEMRNIARYALLGSCEDEQWPVSKLDMDAIDKAGKL